MHMILTCRDATTIVLCSLGGAVFSVSRNPLTCFCMCVEGIGRGAELSDAPLWYLHFQYM